MANGKTVFTEPVSNVKDVTVIQDPTNGSSKVFRLACSDGKNYGLGAASSNTMDLDAFKKKLGK